MLVRLLYLCECFHARALDKPEHAMAKCSCWARWSIKVLRYIWKRESSYCLGTLGSCCNVQPPLRRVQSEFLHFCAGGCFARVCRMPTTQQGNLNYCMTPMKEAVTKYREDKDLYVSHVERMLATCISESCHMIDRCSQSHVMYRYWHLVGWRLSCVKQMLHGLPM